MLAITYPERGGGGEGGAQTNISAVFTLGARVPPLTRAEGRGGLVETGGKR